VNKPSGAKLAGSVYEQLKKDIFEIARNGAFTRSPACDRSVRA